MNKIVHWHFNDKSDEKESKAVGTDENPPNVYGFGLRLFENVIDVVDGEAQSLIDGFEGRKVWNFSAIYQSVETGREVFLDEPPKRYKQQSIMASIKKTKVIRQ